MNYTIETDLKKIKDFGKLRENENFKFRTFLKGQDPNKVDKIVHKLNAEITELIDCTTCGNCCMQFRFGVSDNEIEKLAHTLNTTPKQIKLDYIQTDPYEQYFKNIPCDFLKDKKCIVYDNRPEECREFPYLHKKNFNLRLFGVIDNYEVCPIVFNVFEILKSKLNFK